MLKNLRHDRALANDGTGTDQMYRCVIYEF